MNEKLQNRFHEVFGDVPNTKRVKELQEEIYANGQEKLEDYLRSGMAEEQAIEAVIAGIGDVKGLVASVRETDIFDVEQQAKNRQKNALNISISVGLYFVALISLILLAEYSTLGDGVIVAVFFSIIAIATCFIIYNALSKPKYQKMDDTMVEEFKEWKSEQGTRKKIRSTISSLLWILIVITYLIISFLFNIWAFSWIIFLVGAALEAVISLVSSLKN